MSTMIANRGDFVLTDLGLKAYTTKAKILIFQGGMYSGKTFGILEAIILKCAEMKRSASVIAESIPHIKRGAWKDFIDIYDELLPGSIKSLIEKVNRGERKVYYRNGSVIEFISVDKLEKAKGAKRDILFINEATSFSYKIFQSLQGRTNEITYIDYNPSFRFWVHDKVKGNEGVEFVRSYHIHNPFVSEDKRKEIESYKELDFEYWKVYARGYTGKVKGIIYHNWDVCDRMPQVYDNRWFGLDFGYSNSKTALIEVRLKGGELYVCQHIYRTGLLTPELISIIKEKGFNNKTIVADPAAADAIGQIKESRINIEEANKYAGSVKQGILILKSYKINVLKTSLDLIDELKKYKFKYDEANGVYLDEPVKNNTINDHLLDALRYVALRYLNSPLRMRRDNKVSIKAKKLR